MMKKFVKLFAVCVCISAQLTAQDKYFTKTGKISFYSATAMENIEAVNKSVTSVLDKKSGDFQFAVLMKGFEFKKALMQEDFNENFVESNKFPRATFRGRLLNNQDIDYSANGTYSAKVSGQLSLHGVTKDVETNGTFLISDGKLRANSEFTILLADYNISVPGIVRDKISKTIKINVDCLLEPLNR